ncbi:MAG: hypothetical protein WAN22_23395, partial [Solirubrobacteraceae bacterium]
MGELADRQATICASTGHATAAFGDELYDILPQTRGGYGRLQDFGIRFGYERVVLHLEPHVPAGRLQCNTARTLLLLDHEPLPWARWAEEFAAAMPTEILRLQERVASADCLPRQQAIRNRVSSIMPLYQLSRYRPTRPPRQPSIESAGGGASDEPAGRPATRPQARGGPPTAEAVHTPASKDPAHDGSDRKLSREPADDHPGPGAVVDLPDVAWISARDGSRATGDLEDQAARYHLERHELTINADFRAVTDLISHWQARYRGIAGARTVIEAQVREWCEQILVEVVLAARSRAGATSSSRRCSHRPRSPPPCSPDTCCTQRSRSALARSSVRHEATWAKQSLIRAKWPAATRDDPAFLSASSRTVAEGGAHRESKPAERAERAGCGGPGARVTATEIQELEPAAVLRVPALLSVATTARLL